MRDAAANLEQSERVDIAIIGAGAAGLMAGIWAGRAARQAPTAGGAPLSIVALDGAKKLGAKILVAGGGRCNVTHHAVDESAYGGSSRNAIKKVLRRFGVAEVVQFFAELGVTLKREETGKLFPTTDDAQTVLDALLGAAMDAGVRLVHPWRVGAVEKRDDGRFVIVKQKSAENVEDADLGGTGGETGHDTVVARRVIVCAGGMALPRTGSDGGAYAIMRALGHTVTPRVFPALVPIVLSESCFVRQLSGLTLPTTLWVRGGTGKTLAAFTNSTLCTHFGLSGPGPMDVSRYYFDALAEDAKTELRINWLPEWTAARLDEALLGARSMSPLKFFDRRGQHLPERLVRALCAEARVDAAGACDHLTKEKRRALVTAVCECALPVTGHRGFTHAEATAGGVPLSEVVLETMESRVCPGLHLAGEICDVDGRIGGFNFQWAWSSGYAAGTAAGKAAAGCA